MGTIPFAPFAPFIALPPAVSILAAATAALVAAPSLSAPRVHAGTMRAPEITTIVAVVVAVAVGLAVLGVGLCGGGARVLGRRLATLPWRAAQVEGKAGDAVCPYTGERVVCERERARRSRRPKKRVSTSPPVPTHTRRPPDAPLPRVRRPAWLSPPGTRATSWPSRPLVEGHCCGMKRRKRWRR